MLKVVQLYKKKIKKENKAYFDMLWKKYFTFIVYIIFIYKRIIINYIHFPQVYPVFLKW